MRSIAPGIVGNLSGGDMADAGNNRAGRMRGALGGGGMFEFDVKWRADWQTDRYTDFFCGVCAPLADRKLRVHFRVFGIYRELYHIFPTSTALSIVLSYPDILNTLNNLAQWMKTVFLTRRAGSSGYGCEVAQAAHLVHLVARCVTLPSCNRRYFLKIISRHSTHPNLCLTEDIVRCFATSSKPAALSVPDSLRPLHPVPLQATIRPVIQTR